MRRTRRRYRRRTFGRLGLAALLVIASGVGFLVTSAFTASNTVPTTFISSSTRTIGANDLKPAGCNSVNLTSIVTGTNNFTINSSHALVLGDTTGSTVGDNGNFNCIIGGSGRDHITGKSGDFCQIGPNVNSRYTTCSTF
jgi:hypothetical protein